MSPRPADAGGHAHGADSVARADPRVGRGFVRAADQDAARDSARHSDPRPDLESGPCSEPELGQDTGQARLARTLLAGARDAVLSLPCYRTRGRVGVLDDAGEPVLIFPIGSPPERAAWQGRSARLEVVAADGTRLQLAGRLYPFGDARGHETAAPAGGDGSVSEAVAAAVAGGDVAAAGLHLSDVSLQTRPVGPRAPLAGPVDLDAYLLAAPDLLAAHAPDMIEHLNGEHPAELRRICATDVPLADVLAAQLTAIRPDGLELWRVCLDGASRVWRPFRLPVADPTGLAAELRHLLRHTPT